MNGNNVQSFTADVALTAHLLVKKTATGVDLCGVNDKPIGTVHHDVKITQACDVLLINGFPTHYAVVGNGTAIAVGDEVEQLASGKIGKFVSGHKIGVALEAATSADSIIRIMVYPGAVSADLDKAAAAWTVTNANGAAAAVHSTAVNPTKADFDALLAVVESMNDDLIALKVVLDAAGITTT